MTRECSPPNSATASTSDMESLLQGVNNLSDQRESKDLRLFFARISAIEGAPSMARSFRGMETTNLVFIFSDAC